MLVSGHLFWRADALVSDSQLDEGDNRFGQWCKEALLGGPTTRVSALKYLLIYKLRH